MKNILITGAGGFIGSQLSKRLRAEGKNVIALVSHLGGYHEASLLAAGCIVEFGSVTNIERMMNVLSTHEIDTVFHLAAYAIVRLSARDPFSTYQVNVMGTVSLLEACRIVGGVKKIVVASSDKAYGDHEQLPYLETHPLQPKNTYDTSKACMDMISRSYAHNYGMPIVVTRCSNVYGPGDMNWSRIIPNTCKRIVDGLRPMLYSDVEKMIREFIYIDDVVDAYVLLGESSDITNGKAYNIGGTGHTSIRNVVDTICNGKSDPVIVERENTFKEIEKQYIDASALSRDTGWSPKIELQDGLKRTMEWVWENS